MVSYQQPITVTAGTAEATLETTTLPVTQGRLRRARVKFFKGPESTVHVRLIHQNRQILPANPEYQFTGNDDGIPIHANIPIGNPQEIKIEAWNTDATNNHDIIVEVEIEVSTPQSEAEAFSQVGPIGVSQRRPVPNVYQRLGLIR